MKKYAFQSCVIMTMLLVSTIASAQVTIGRNEPPKFYSVLELVSAESGSTIKRGLRLPQMNLENRILLEASANFQAEKGDATSNSANALAEGLQIFNTDTGCVETWGGDEWVMNCFDDAATVDDALAAMINNIPENVDYPASN
ncbi:MAG: hypothetical protein LBR75_06850 [Prevotellaceae bacterium]|jgi:hypothetical protein|nr:hypothetical protein [Prevotellaceae bacterium]